MTSHLQQEITDLEKRMEAYKHLIRITRSDMSGENSAYVARTLKMHQDRIAFHLKEIQKIKHRCEHGPQIIEDAQAQLREMKQRLGVLKHKREIEKLILLQEQINKLTPFFNAQG